MTVDDLLYAPIHHGEPAQDILTGTEVVRRQQELAESIDLEKIIGPFVPPDKFCLYELTGECFLDGRLRHSGERIIWTDTPNHAMKPINDAAKECYARFIDRVGPPV